MEIVEVYVENEAWVHEVVEVEEEKESRRQVGHDSPSHYLTAAGRLVEWERRDPEGAKRAREGDSVLVVRGVGESVCGRERRGASRQGREGGGRC